MPVTAPYAEIAPTVAALKALTPEERCPNHCLFIPAIGLWVYYSPTATTTANNTTIFEPNDGLGRWIVTNQSTAPSGGSSGGSGITQQPGIAPAQATLADLQRATNQIISTLVSAGVTLTTQVTRNYDSANPARDLIQALGTNGDTVAYSNPHPGKITNSASSVAQGSVNTFTDRVVNDFATNNVVNSWIQIDFGSARSVSLSGLGLASRLGFGSSFPVSVVIEGSNDGSAFAQIFTWSSIGFTAANQPRFTTFGLSPNYRFIRIRQPGTDSSGGNFLTLGELYLYGTLSVL